MLRTLSISFLLVLSFATQAQRNLSYFTNKITEIDELDDIHEGNYQRAEFSKDFKAFLSSNKELIINPSDSSNNISIVETHDFNHRVYHCTFKLNETQFQSQAFIVYSYKNQKSVVSLSRNISISKKDRKLIKPQLHTTLNEVEHTETVYYNYVITDSEGVPYYQIEDLSSLCLFEALYTIRDIEILKQIEDSVSNRMKSIFENRAYFKNDFSSFQRMSTQQSDDNRIKICTWGITLNNGQQLFGGALIRRIESGEVKYFPLTDKTGDITRPQSRQLSNKEWYGAIYYQMQSFKMDKKEKAYLLLGYKPHNEMSKKKVVDVLWFTNNGEPRFGKALFESDRRLVKRVVFEYAASSNMTLRYDQDSKMVVFDHLAPSDPIHTGDARFYGPDFSYDGFFFDKGRWTFKREIDVRNPKQ